ncbi:MAG: lamin tail domain-containing protein [Verrucomicrobiales bacterium]|nr:lamin tail domain-containing protein [Verrucomicrobiales bacterium]
MNKRFLCWLPALFLGANAHLHSALLVDLDATAASPGTLNPWNNAGSLGGSFAPTGAAAVTAIPKNDGSGNVNAVTFSAATQYYLSSFNVPASVTGQGARSVEVWAYNPATPTIGVEETMVAWGRRGGGPNNSNMAFNYGSDARWGAVGHWGTANDVGWGMGNNVNPGSGATAGAFPATGQWHHLVYTYDGTATDRLFVDGVLVNQEIVGVLATHSTYNNSNPTKFVLGCQPEANGGVIGTTQGTLSIAKVRIRDQMMTPWEIRDNYNLEAATFGRVGMSGPSIRGFSVNPSQFVPGQQISLTYDVPGATDLSVDHGVGTLSGTSGALLLTAPADTTTFTLTATDASGSSTATTTACRKDQIPVLRHRYSFNTGGAGEPAVGNTATTSVPDSVGGAHGTIRGATFRWGEVSAGAGNRGGQLVVNPLAADNATVAATTSYVDLPNGLLTSRACDFTVEGWVTCDGVQRWSRVFDFGTNNYNEQSIAGHIVGPNSSSGTDYLMLSAVNGTAGQQNVLEMKRFGGIGSGGTYVGAPAYGTQYHFVVAYDRDGNAGTPKLRYYRNGAFVGSINTGYTPEGFLDVNCWLGRSNYSGAGNDLNLEGSFNEFRIYDGAFTDADAATSHAQGPDVIYDPGNIPVNFVIHPANATVARNAPVTFSATAAGTPPVSYQWYRNGTAIAGATASSYVLPGVTLVDSGSTFHVTATNTVDGTPYAATSNTATLTVNAAGEALRHRYPFSANFTDVISGANGTGFSANATVVPAAGASSVTLAAANQQYLDLPASGAGGLNLNTYTQVTFEAWANFGTNGGWARLFDMGNTNVGNTQGFSYLFFSPHSGGNDVRMSFVDTTGGANERFLTATPVLDNLGWVHLAAIFDPTRNREQMYLNGVLVAEATFADPTPGILPPLSVVGIQKAYLGRSLYADPFMQGEIDEFRIYNVALSAAEIAANYAAGPNSPPPAPSVIAFTQHPQNATVNELQAATFLADVSGPKPLTAQWYQNGSPIPGATSLTWSYIPSPADSGSTFFCRVSGTVGGNPASVDSNPATLGVLADLTAPTLISAQNTDATTVVVSLSEPVTTGTGGNPANYALSDGVVISTVLLAPDRRSVSLTTSTPLVAGNAYTVTVSNLQDGSAAANTIVPNSQKTFVVSPFTLSTLGAGIPPGTLSTAPGGGYSLTGYGTGPTGTSDQVFLASQSRTGDFDVNVRLGALSLSNLWARGGIMARSGTGEGDLFAAAVATPGPSGCFFSSRNSFYGAAAHAGSYPTNYPSTWLRLKRAGNLFTAYASLDGQSWTPLGSGSVVMPATVSVGLFTSSASADSTTGTFFDYGEVSGGSIVSNPALPVEPDGPSTRFSNVVISEIMYNPNAVNGAGELEFVELHNTAPYPEDLAGWQFKGGITCTLPAGISLPAGGYLVIARVPADVEAAYGITGVLGPWTGSLSNSGEQFRLENENGSTMCEVEYHEDAPWPVAAAGLGHSLVLAKPSYGENDARAWAASNDLGGSPGRRDPFVADPARGVSINEFLANSESPAEDFVELFNATGSPVDVGGLLIGDGATLGSGFSIPAGTTIAARGHLAFTETQLGFGLGSDGERLWLFRPGVRVIDALSFTGQDVNVSRDHSLRELASATPGAANADEKVRAVIINEIMYHPISDDRADEYIELYNRSAETVDLSGWSLGGDVAFTLPTGTSIAAGGFLVIASDSAHLLTRGYAGLNAANCIGNFTGSLSNGGGRISLRLPVVYAPPGGGSAIAFATADEVTYRDGGRWGLWSDGGGSSLELRDPRADNRLAANWGDSDERSKAAYTNLTITARQDYRHPGGNGIANRAEFFLQGVGECLVDEISIMNGVNQYVTNGGFESGIGAWVPQGDQKQALLQASGAAAGTNCLKLVASDRGDTGANRVRSALTTTLPDNLDYVLSAKVKWQRGTRYFHLRVRGNGLELPGVLDVPTNLGSPGMVNSITAANTAPAVSDVVHAPVLPAAGESVVVSARISDPDNVSAASLLWRNDTDSGATSTVSMKDDGSGGDAFAGDGIYSAVIPGQSAGKLIAFKIQATDAAASPLTATFPTPNPLIFPASLQARECLVRFGEAPQYGSLGSYRLWVTNATLAEWTAREKNSNQPLDATFVLGNHRVFYNVSTLYSGSPWHMPAISSPVSGNVADYEVMFNPDDAHLGTTDFVLQAQDGGVFNDDPMCQAELTAFWMSRKLGLYSQHKRHVHFFINGTRRALVYEDAQQPGGRSVEQHLRSKPDGTLYKIEDWFEFDDAGQGQNNQNANLPETSTTINGVSGVRKPARYRWNWRIRGQDDPNNYAPVFSLVGAMNAPNTPTDVSFVTGVEAQVDTRNWLRTILAHHIIGNWDAYGYERGKNGYAYKPLNGKWVQFAWDMDFAFGTKSARPPSSDIFAADGNAANADRGQPETRKLLDTPAFRREYLCGALDAANGPLASGAADPFIDARHADFIANGIPAAAPDAMKSYISSRRAYLLSVVPTAALAVTSPLDTTTANETLTMTGTAPVCVDSIEINGLAYPVRWTSVTAWTIDVPLVSGINTLNGTARDASGSIIGTFGPVTATFTGTTTWAALRINEWLAQNNSGIVDPADGNYEDWLEIFNPSANPVSLAGWYVSDDLNNPSKSRIPAGFSIPAGGFLRIWADSSSTQNDPANLHVDFKLSTMGEALLLTAPDGTLMDSLVFGPQQPDVTEGRFADGTAGIYTLTEPTPGASNILVTYSSHSLGGGTQAIVVNSIPGRSYRAEASADLNVWSVLGTQAAGGATLTFTDPNAGAADRRFYRIVLLPPP